MVVCQHPCQSAVRAAAHRIFRHTIEWSEHPRVNIEFIIALNIDVNIERYPLVGDVFEFIEVDVCTL
ncbi:MAG: hypothetical protein M2R45_05179 [Verrucomicrobia subdivision 3 bacterium]|nr:hypothetical protein [Limisphaerales bacterium]MCS1416299.1 hypothetical protein [Limisphaerales bacterium]